MTAENSAHQVRQCFRSPALGEPGSSQDDATHLDPLPLRTEIDFVWFGTFRGRGDKTDDRWYIRLVGQLIVP